MKRLIIDLDMDRCCACGACAVACMDQNDIDTSGESPLRCVFTLENRAKGTVRYVSLACMHCIDAPCVMACPVGCISKDEGTGFSVYDNANCIGCRNCSMACPYGAISFSAEGKMQKCDGCITRIESGLEPACVRTCTVNALSLYDEKEHRIEKLTASIIRVIDMTMDIMEGA